MNSVLDAFGHVEYFLAPGASAQICSQMTAITTNGDSVPGGSCPGMTLP